MKPNILFLVIDSLRQDKCLGENKSSKTPNLDKLINNGVFFRETISPASITIPSLSSIFTGKYPFECTTLDNDLFNLKTNSHTFIHELANSGYTTHAIIPDAFLHTNIPCLFSKYEFFNSFSTLYDENLGERIVNKIKNLSKEQPWFLYVHLEDLHGNAIFHLSDNDKINSYSGNNQYDKMLSALDFWLGKISNTLKTENTLFIITSDHGSTTADFTEKMFKFNLQNDQLRDNKKITESKNLLRSDVMKSYNEKQSISYKIGHKFFTSLPDSLQVFRKKSADAYIKKRKKTIKKNLLTRLNKIEKLNPTPYQKRLLQKSVIYPNDCYDENFRPALIFSGYNIPPKKTINSQISSIDIFPTILEIIEIDTQMNSHGRSVLPLINNENFEENPAFLDNAAISSEIEYGDTVGVRTSNFKYFRDRINPEKDVHLFNLINDPLELSNISKENSDIVEKFEKNLLQINPSGKFSFEQTNELNKDDTEKAKDILRNLGYIK